eukprot:TRINITY_DN26750_c0_g1_i2.p1 TRINITY_DN26750_c0_g1~~TRINITY_DN26750_c0_g1_i2.p1  ORF type:complete len:229 (-),score=56.32 TRINITY_DN26750_c0_g1_i2:21-707(-)
MDAGTASSSSQAPSGREELFAHLRWYTTQTPRPVGELEKRYGAGFAPGKLCAAAASSRSTQPTQPNGAEAVSKLDPAAAAAAIAAAAAEKRAEEEAINLSRLIEYLEEEVKEKELPQRSQAWLLARERGDSLDGFLHGRGLEGQPALDAYVSELVARLRDFPYMSLPAGREAGAWVRDELVAPCFAGRWDFYSNRKEIGFDLNEFSEALCGTNMLLDRLRFDRQAAGM